MGRGWWIVADGWANWLNAPARGDEIEKVRRQLERDAREVARAAGQASSRCCWGRNMSMNDSTMT
jgi:hypothetical protein